MRRSNLLPLVALWAAGVVGCAHCDICDDFPAPCTGPGCYTGGTPGGTMMAPAGAAVPVTNASVGAAGPVSSTRSTNAEMPPPAVDVPPLPAGNDAARPSPPPADANAEPPK